MLSPCRQGWSLPLCPYQRLRRITSTAGLPAQWAARRGGGSASLTHTVLQRGARGHTQHSVATSAAGGDGVGASAAAPSAATSDRVLGVRVEVREGDTIDGLAAEVGLPREALLAANQGSPELTPGDVLEVLLGKASPVIDVGPPTEPGGGDAAAARQQQQQQRHFSDGATPTKRQVARDERRAGRRRQLREFEAEQRHQQRTLQWQQQKQLETAGVEQRPDWHAQALSRQAAASTAGVGDATAATAAEAVAAEPASVPVRLREQATSVLSSPVAIGFLVALAAATLGSRLLQATGRGRDAAAQRAADSPEAAMLAAAAAAARVLGSADRMPAEDDILGRGRLPTAAVGSGVDGSSSGSGSGSGASVAAGPAIGRYGSIPQPQVAAEPAAPADAATPAQQQQAASNGSIGGSVSGVGREADSGSGRSSSGTTSGSSGSDSEGGGKRSGSRRSDGTFPVGTSPVDGAAFMALPYLATVREEGSGRAVLVSLLGGEDAMLAFESRQDASDFANVTGSIDPEAPVAAVFHSPADLAARVAARGCGLVVVPKGAVQMRIGDGHARFFRDLFSSCRVLSPAAAAGLLQPALNPKPNQAAVAAADASRDAAAAPAAAEEPASAAQLPPDRVAGAAAGAAADASADTAAAAAPLEMAAAAAAAVETSASSAATEVGASAAAEQTEQSSATAAADVAEPLLAVGLSLDGAESGEEAGEEWSDDDLESDAEDGLAESPADSAAALFDSVIDVMPEPAGSRNGSGGSGTSRGGRDGSGGGSEGSSDGSGDGSGSPAKRDGITAATLPPGAWRRLPFVCVPHVRYAADADAVSFVTADLALEGQQPVRHVLAFADRHDASAAQAAFEREAAAPAEAQLHVVPMLPAEAAAAARQHGFDGVTVFATGAMRLRPGMGLEDLAQLAFDALRGGGDGEGF